MRPIGVVGIPGAASSEALAAAFRARGVDSFVLEASSLAHEVASGTVTFDGRDVLDLGAVVVKKLGDAASPLASVRATHLRAIEAEGVPVYSPAESIVAAVDRHTMTQRLGAAGLPMPDTLITEDPAAAAAFVRSVGRVVYKPRFTSKARGMQVIGADDDLEATLAAIAEGGGLPYYLQRFLPDVERDIGVAVCDGEVIGAYYRVRSGHGWSTTTSAGGRYERCPLDPQLERLALRATAIFGLTFTTVDVVRHDGRAYIYEVSAFGGFSGLKACGVDGAARFADAVIAKARPIDERR